MQDHPPDPDPDRLPDPVDLGDVLRYYIRFLRRGWRVIALSVAAGLALAVLYQLTARRSYEAVARLLILQQGARPLSVSNTDPNRLSDNFEDYIPTQMQIIISPLVAERVIASVGLENLPTLAEYGRNGRKPVDGLINALRLDRPDRMARTVRLSYSARSQDEAVRTLDAVVKSYQSLLDESDSKKNTEVIVLIAKARDELLGELRALEGKYLDFRRDKGVLTIDDKGRPFVAMRMEQLYRAANEARIKSVQLKSQLDVARELAAKGAGLWAIVHAMDQLGSSASGPLVSGAAATSQATSLEYLRELNNDRQKLIERYGAQNSKVREISKKLERLQDGMHDTRSRIDRGEVGDLLASLEHSYKKIEVVKQELLKEYDDHLAEAKQSDYDIRKEADLKADIERQRMLFNTVVDQLKQARFVGDYGTITSQAIEPPHPPQGGVSPRPRYTLAAGLFAGCLIGISLAMVREHLDPRVRSFAELRKILAVPVLGQVPTLSKEQAALVTTPALVAHSLPRSVWAETFRSARTKLESLHRRQAVQTILVTSPCPGDGKSTVASNLAISLAQSGRKVLLVDADLRSPLQGRIHNVPTNRGLTHILNGLLPLDRLVQDSGVEDLDLLTAGPKTPKPAELLSAPELAEFLDDAKRRYDYVVIDSSPLLSVTDPSVIAASVDGVLLVVNASTVNREEARHAAEHLRSLGTPVLGALVNGVNPEHTADGYRYGFGAYRQPDDAEEATGPGPVVSDAMPAEAPSS